MSVLSRAFIALSLAATSTAAQAAETVYVGTQHYSSNYSLSMGGLRTSGGAGAFEAHMVDQQTAQTLDVYSYCIEPMVSGASGYYDVLAGSAYYGSVKLQQLANLLKNGNELLSTLVDGSTQYRNAGFALGLAVWEITQEGLSTNYSLRTGDFRVFGGTNFSTVRPLVDRYLANVANGTWTGGDLTKVKVLASREDLNWLDRQDMIFYDPRNPTVPGGAVPEPGTWAMLMVGFGAVGIAMRRRRDPNVTTRVRFA